MEREDDIFLHKREFLVVSYFHNSLRINKILPKIKCHLSFSTSVNFIITELYSSNLTDVSTSLDSSANYFSTSNSTGHVKTTECSCSN